MSDNATASDDLLAEATELADVVTDYSHYAEMAHALRVARRALGDGEDGASIKKRLTDGLKIIALARELWVGARA